jgi:hypothetical protein
MEYRYTIMKKHPARNCWMVFVPKAPYIPPYFGTKRECEKARECAEKNAEEYFNNAK